MDAGQVARLWAGRAEPILPSTSIERTLEFWGAFGFESEIWEDGGYAWVFPGPDGIRIDYSLSDGLDPFESSSMAYLSVPDIDAVYESIVASGSVPQALDAHGLPLRTTRELRDQWRIGGSLARLTRPIDQTWGKRELALFDPDNKPHPHRVCAAALARSPLWSAHESPPRRARRPRRARPRGLHPRRAGTRPH